MYLLRTRMHSGKLHNISSVKWQETFVGGGGGGGGVEITNYNGIEKTRQVACFVSFLV
jgi:hypothetical protein